MPSICLLIISLDVIASAAPTLDSRDVCNQGINNLALWLANYAPVRSFCPVSDLSEAGQQNYPITQISVTTVVTAPATKFTTTYAIATTLVQPFKAKRQDYTDENTGSGLNLGGLFEFLSSEIISPFAGIVPTACSCLQRPVITLTSTEYHPTTQASIATVTSTIQAQVAVPVCATAAPFVAHQWQTCHFTAQCGALILLESIGFQWFGDQSPTGYTQGLASRGSADSFLDCFQQCASTPSSSYATFSFGTEGGICDLFTQSPGSRGIQDGLSVNVKYAIGWAWCNLAMDSC